MEDPLVRDIRHFTPRECFKHGTGEDFPLPFPRPQGRAHSDYISRTILFAPFNRGTGERFPRGPCQGEEAKPHYGCVFAEWGRLAPIIGFYIWYCGEKIEICVQRSVFARRTKILQQLTSHHTIHHTHHTPQVNLKKNLHSLYLSCNLIQFTSLYVRTRIRK